MKSGSDLECLHASVGEKRRKCVKNQKEAFLCFCFVLFLFFCLMAVLLSEAQTEIPHKKQESYLPAIVLGGVILKVRVHAWGVGKRSHSHHAHPPCSVGGTRLNKPPAVSHSGSEGSQSGRSACSVLCTSSGRSFGLLFA